MKSRFVTILLACLFCHAMIFATAEWEYIKPIAITDPVLKQSLINHAYMELEYAYPNLTNTQITSFSVTAVCEMPEENTYRVQMVYDNCESVIFYVDIVCNEDGKLQTVNRIPWDLEGLVMLYDNCLSADEALVIGRLSLANALYEHYQQYPDAAREFVANYGVSMLDPSNFVVEASFVTPLNGDSHSIGAYWSIRFGVAFDPDAGANWTVNSLWYHVKIDANTGEILYREPYYIFSDFLH